MELRLGDAYYNVYCSCKEILKNKQTHLYCSMLDLLKTTCKAVEYTDIEKIGIEELVQFWMIDILPLVFDIDNAVQSSAIIAMEAALEKMDIVTVHKSNQWPKIKEIITNYAQRIHDIRNNNNNQWYQIWCIIIRILDKEIVKNPRIINTFLKVVELGFRSPEHEIRTQAFFCWSALITLFSKYNELIVPKRLKLICIPLKSSQSKSEESAIAKFRVWWHLITCLGRDVAQFFDIVVEPFLVFLFGSDNRQTIGVAYQYKSMITMALLSVADLFDVPVETLMNEYDLKQFGIISTLTNNEIINKHWDIISTTIFNCLKAIDNDMLNTESIQKIMTRLLEFLLNSMSNLCIADFYVKFCESLVQLIPEHVAHAAIIMKILSEMEIAFLVNTHIDPNHYTDVICAFINMFAVVSSTLEKDIIFQAIKCVFSLDIDQNNHKVWSALHLVMAVVNRNDKNICEKSFEIKLFVWRQISHYINKYIEKHTFECRSEERSAQLNQWIIWPLTSLHHNIPLTLDREFCTLWKQLMIGTEHCFGRLDLLNDINKYLIDLLPTFANNDQFILLLDTHANAIYQLDFNGNEHLYKNVFDNLGLLITSPSSSKTKETCLDLIKQLLSQMKPSNLISLLKSIKGILKKIVEENENKKLIRKWKQSMMQNLYGHLEGDLKIEFQTIFRNKDDPIVISSVWSFNPEKLTERQRERFEGKTVIPALYNDLSVSQDTSLKPWTPNNIAIASKGVESPIAIESKSNKTECVTEQESSIVKELNSEILPNTIIVPIEESDKPIRRTRQSAKFQLDGVLQLNSNRKSVTPKRKKQKQYLTTNIQCESKIEDSTAKKISEIENVIKKTDNPVIPMHGNLNEQNSKTFNLLDNTTDSSNIFSHTGFTDLDNVQAENKFEDSTATKISEIATVVDRIKETGNPVVPMHGNLNEQNLNPTLFDDTTEKSRSNTDLTKIVHVELEEVDDGNLLGNPNNEPIISNISKLDNNLADDSPKKYITKLPTLLSPPDRKLTNNQSSPTLRHKPSGYLTGRGAQLINMIRNKKVDNVSPCPAINANKKITIMEPANTPMQQLPICGLDQNSTHHDMLTFSKRLPSPTASPSVSILKRKSLNESTDEGIAGELHTNKKKRVSFHDPPVSITKEYVKDASETKIKPKRCLIMEKSINEFSPDSQLNNHSVYYNDINTFDSNDTENVIGHSVTSTADKNIFTNEKSVDIGGLSNTNSDFDTINSKKILPKSKPQNFDYIMNNVPLNLIMDPNFKTSEETTVKLCNVMVKFLSKHMNDNATVKTNVLENLSENHSKDFLDYAIRENLSTVVCDRLNINSVIDYVCAKSKINTSCRSKFLVEIPEILKQIKIKSELSHFLKSTLKQCELSDIDILNMITALISLRDENKSCSAAMELTADSSSNL